MAFDFSPLYRSSIGFDGMTALFARALERDDGNPRGPQATPHRDCLGWRLGRRHKAAGKVRRLKAFSG